MSPAGDSVSIAVDAPIEITFDRLMDTPKVIAGLTISPEITYQASWNGPLLTLEPSNPLDLRNDLYGHHRRPGGGYGWHESSANTLELQDGRRWMNVESLIPGGRPGRRERLQPDSRGLQNEPIDPSSIGGAIKVSPSVSGTIRAISPVRNQDRDRAGQSHPRPHRGPTAIVFTPDNSACTAHPTGGGKNP